MFTFSISKPSVSAGVALKSLSVAAIATLSTLVAPGAQAATISGQVSGIWNNNYTSGGLNGGDAFTADYTYDSDSITTTDYSYYGYDRYLYSVAPLLSLVFKSGAITHVFDNLDNNDAISWWDIDSDFDSNTDYELKQTGVSASESLNSVWSSFYSYVYDQNYYGTPGSGSNARASQYDSSYRYSYYGYTNSGVSISDTTAVPTPALLPGLIGMGVGVLRRRKQAKAETVAV